MGVKLRYYQAESTPALATHIFTKPKRNPIVAYPTGAGKSYCIADFIQWARERGAKILVLCHVWEILEQNAASIEKYCGEEVGIYSASAGRKDVKDVTVGGIQSVYRQPQLFKDFDFVVIDECHRVSYDPDSMYRKFLSALEAMVIGFTATYYRLGTGYIYGESDEHLFQDVVVDWTHKEKFVQLVNEGFLTPLTCEGTGFKMDAEDIRMTGGDFNLKDLALKYDRASVTEAILKEIVEKGKDRKQWLLFAIDMDHADHIAEWLNRNGISTIVVHSRMREYGFDRDKVIQDIKGWKYRCVVNVDILTTGFDHPGIDLIGLLRLTESPVLHVQMCGRGSRTHPGKLDCLVLDFAGNLERLGPINDPLIKVKGKGKGGGEPIMKECPKCNLMVHAAVRVCTRCGYKFPREHGLVPSASNAAVIDSGEPVWLIVNDVTYEHKQGFGRPSTLKVTYHCGNRKITETICLEHRGFARQKAHHWIKYRGGTPTSTVAEFMPQTELLKKAVRIRVEKKGKYFNISESVFRD